MMVFTNIYKWFVLGEKQAYDDTLVVPIIENECEEADLEVGPSTW